MIIFSSSDSKIGRICINLYYLCLLFTDPFLYLRLWNLFNKQELLSQLDREAATV